MRVPGMSIISPCMESGFPLHGLLAQYICHKKLLGFVAVFVSSYSPSRIYREIHKTCFSQPLRHFPNLGCSTGPGPIRRNGVPGRRADKGRACIDGRMGQTGGIGGRWEDGGTKRLTEGGTLHMFKNMCMIVQQFY